MSAAETIARYSDHEALARFARSVDVVTLEWENIPVQTVAFLAKFVPVHPGPGVLAIAQDRLLEKDFVNRLGIATAPGSRPLPRSGGDGVSDHRHALHHEIGPHGL